MHRALVPQPTGGSSGADDPAEYTRQSSGVSSAEPISSQNREQNDLVPGLPEASGKQCRLIIAMLILIVILLTAYALQLTRIVSLPLALAFFITTAVRPVQRWVSGRMPERFEWVGAAAGMLTVLAVIAAAGGLLAVAVDAAEDQVPRYIDRLSDYAEQARQFLGGYGLSLGGGEGNGLAQRLMGYVGSLTTMLGGAVLVLFLSLLMMLETGDWRGKFQVAFAGRTAEDVLKATRSISNKVRRYLLVRAFVSFISAVCAGLFLWAMQVDFALLWALLVFVLNFIPNIGSVIAVIPPVLTALVDQGWWWAGLVLLGLGAIEQIIGNFIDPKLTGRELQLSPVAVLLSVAFWGWLWGTIGALIAVPMTATLMVVGVHIKRLRPYALLLTKDADAARSLAREEANVHGGTFAG